MGDNKIANRKVYVYIDGTQVEKSVNGINEQLRKVRAEQRKLTLGSAEYIAASKKIKQLEGVMSEHRHSIEKTEKSWFSLNKAAESCNKYFSIITASVAALTGITFAVRKSVDSFAALEEKEADVRKYTGMTKKEVKDLNESFEKMNTRTAREQLNALAADAGRLGIKSKNEILDFVQAADIIKISLGEDLGKDAIKNIGKLAQMFGSEGTSIKERMLSVGSAINEVAQNSSASEPYLVDFSARLAGTAKQANISAGDLMGFGSVLDQNMQQVEMAATALQSVILKMYQDPAKFAKVAGKDVKEFTELMKTDANEAIITLLTSLRNTGGLEKLAPIFKETGLDGVRAAGVINTLAGNIENIRKEQETANSAFKKGTSVISEFDIKNNTLQATIDKAKKSFTEMSYELGERLAPYMSNFISIGGQVVKMLSTLSGFVIRNSIEIVSLGVAVFSYVAYLKLSVLWGKKTIIIQSAIAVANGVLKGSLYLLQVAYYLLTQQMGKARGAMLAFSLVTKLNPFAALTAAVSVLIVGIVAYAHKMKEVVSIEKILISLRGKAIKSTLDQRIELDLLLKTAKNEKLSLEQRKIAMDKINTISPEFLGNLKLEEINTNKATIARDKYIASLQRTAMAEIAHDKIKESLLKMDDLKENLAFWVDKSKLPFMDGLNGPATLRIMDITKEINETGKALNNYKKIAGDIQEEIIKNSTLPTSDSINPDIEGIDINSELSKIALEADLRRKETSKQYAKDIINRQVYEDKMYDIELEALNKKIALYKKGSTEQESIQSEIYELMINKKGRSGKSLDKGGAPKDELQNIQDHTTTLRTAALAKYAMGEDDRSTHEQKLYDIELESLTKTKALYKDGSAEHARIQGQIYQLTLDHKQKLADKYINKTLNELDRSFDKEKLILENQKAQNILSEEAYHEAMLTERLRYLEAKKVLYKDNPEESEKIQGEIEQTNSDYKTKRSDRFAKKRETFESTYKEKSPADLQAEELNALQALNDAKIISEEEFQEERQEVLDKYAAIEQEKNAEEVRKKTEAVQASIAILQSIMSAYSDYLSAAQQAEEAEVSSKYDAEIKAAGKNTTQVKKIEEKKEKELAAIKSKYADKAFAMQIAQAIASTAQAAINAYASAAQTPFIGPVLGPIAAGMAVAAGMLQVASIKKQHEVAKKGYAKGGFTPSGKWDEEQGVVHSDEFIANRFATANSSIRPVFDVIDLAQRAGTVASLTGDDLARALNPSTNYTIKRNEATNPTSNSNAVATEKNTALLLSVIERNNEVMERMTQRLNEPFQTINTVTGEHGMKQALDEYNELIQNKSRK